MLAFILLLLIALEGTLFAALGAKLLPAAWIGWPALLLCALAGVIVVRALMVVLSFALAWRHRTPRGAEDRIGWRPALRLYAREAAAQILAFCVLQPLMWFFVRRAWGSGGGIPIVLVPGLWCNAAVWWWFARALRKHHAGPVAAVTLEPPLADIDLLADGLHARLDSLCAATGASQVILIGHSMGGLIARAYLRRHSSGRVAKLITLATPHHGSVLAGLSFGRCAEQMRPGNEWLCEWQRAERTALPLPVVSFFSVHDNLVAPQASSVLPGARNIPLRAVGHMEMLFRRDVLDQVIEQLNPPQSLPQPISRAA